MMQTCPHMHHFLSCFWTVTKFMMLHTFINTPILLLQSIHCLLTFPFKVFHTHFCLSSLLTKNWDCVIAKAEMYVHLLVTDFERVLTCSCESDCTISSPGTVMFCRRGSFVIMACRRSFASARELQTIHESFYSHFLNKHNSNQSHSSFMNTTIANSPTAALLAQKTCAFTDLVLFLCIKSIFF